MANDQNLSVIRDTLTAKERGSLGGQAKKGKKHVSKWIDDLLHDESFKAVIRQGIEIKEFNGAPIKAIIGAQLALAIQGDSKAADLLFKYGYGTKQEIQHSGAVDTGVTDPKLAAEFTEFLKNKTKED